MGRRLGIILTIVLALIVLVAINSLAYVTEEEKPDSELSPNRSTYNAGSTGTRALYDFLNESGYKVMRWRESPEKLLGEGGEKVRTFVIIGDTRVPVDEEEATNLLAWVELGGRLVVIDRRPETALLAPSGEWTVTTEFLKYPDFEADPADAAKMTKGVTALSPAQSTLLTRDVGSVMPSRYFSAIKFAASKKTAAEIPTPVIVGEDTFGDEDDDTDEAESVDDSPVASPAPVVHLGSTDSAQLVDYAYGDGRIIVLSDPFIVGNVGLALNDNLQLAVNLLAGPDGMIAFDEFHQGRGVTRNAFASYFSGTPVLWICAQIALLVILVLFTRGRRFARPLPLPRVDRRSSLEFVASMAELQQRARAFDLAIENVYSRTRRALARYGGVDYNSSRSVIAARIASRSSLDAHQIETLMRQSEEAINGGEISERQSIHLVRRLREIESALGLRMRSREIKQSAQNL